MALDSLVLEEEVRQGRISLNHSKNYPVADCIDISTFNEGVIALNLGIYKEDLPEGYILYYGFNQNKQAAYYVNVVDLLKAEGSKKWVDVAIHTQARENEGIEIKRIANKMRNVDIEHNLKRKITKKELEELRFENKAKFSKEDWETIKKYAVPVKRAKRLNKLIKEVKDYTYSTIKKLANEFEIGYGQLPEVKINMKKRWSHYNSLKNKITLNDISTEVIHHEVGHYLYMQYALSDSGNVAIHKLGSIPQQEIATPELPTPELPENTISHFELFFRKAIEETISYYCEEIGKKRIAGSKLNKLIYYQGSQKLENVVLVTRIMDVNLVPEEVFDLSRGLIENEVLQDLHEYTRDIAELDILAHDLGVVFANYIWEQGGKGIIRHLIISQETEYAALFLNTKRLLTKS